MLNTHPLLSEKNFLEIVKREKGSLSLPDFAKKLHGAISPQFISNILLGRKHPPDSLAKALGFERVVCFRKRMVPAKAKAKPRAKAKPKAAAAKAA